MAEEPLKTSRFTLSEIYGSGSNKTLLLVKEEKAGISVTTVIVILGTAALGAVWVYNRYQVKLQSKLQESNDLPDTGTAGPPISIRGNLTEAIQNSRISKIESRLKQTDRKVNEMYYEHD